MGFIAYLVLGLIAGAIAKAILPGKQGGGLIATLIVGVIGAMLGGWIGGAIFGADMNEFFSISTWLCASSAERCRSRRPRPTDQVRQSIFIGCG